MKVVKEIPERSRRLVSARDGRTCQRCGVPTLGGQWHHRRSRKVRDDWTHSPTNGIWLCHVCHRWVHANPLLAKANGWIVSRTELPTEVPFQRYDGWWIMPYHEGSYIKIDAIDLEDAIEQAKAG